MRCDCGEDVVAGARFCRACGAPAGPGDAFATVSRPSRAPLDVEPGRLADTPAAGGRPRGADDPRGGRAGVRTAVVAAVAAGAAVVAVVAVVVVVAGRGAEPAEPDLAAARAPTSAPSTTEAEAEPDVVEAAGAAVYQVLVDGCAQPGVGTAFAVDAHHLVTNAHVVQWDTEPDVVSRDGERIAARVIGWSIAPDVAVLEVAPALDAWLTWADGADPGDDREVAALGYSPTDARPTAQRGVVSGAGGAVTTDLVIGVGTSGGPVLADDGRVVGIATATNAGNPATVIAAAEAAAVVTSVLAAPNPPTVSCAVVDPAAPAPTVAVTSPPSTSATLTPPPPPTTPTTAPAAAPPDAGIAAELAQRLASALADGDWATARALEPSKGWSDEEYATTYADLVRSTVLVLGSTPASDGVVELQLAVVAHQERPSGRLTSVYCATWLADVAAGTIEPTSWTETSIVRDGWVDPGVLTAPSAGEC